MRPNVALIVIPLAGTLACGASTVGPEDFVLPLGAPPPVVTDAAVYTLEDQDGGYVAEAVATYTNSTGRPVYYQRCTPEFTGRSPGCDGLGRTAPLACLWAARGRASGASLPGGFCRVRVSRRE